MELKESLVLALWIALCSGITWRAWWHGKALRRLSMPIAVSLGCWGVVDLGVFAALPVLGLSFAKEGVPWMLLFNSRVFLFVAGAMVLRAALKQREELSRPGMRALIGGLGGINVLILVVALYGLYIEPFQLTVTRLEFPAAVDTGTRVRIVHLSDIHVERTTAREQALVPLVNGLEPDLILITGDYLNLSYLQDPQAVSDLRALLSQLHARYGIYAVDGTVEEPERLRELVAGLEVTVLDDAVKRVEIPGSELYLVGVSNRDPWAFFAPPSLLPRRDPPALERLMQAVPPEATSVLLYHTPDLIDTAAQTGVDLYLAGHMHGGQIRLPFYGALVAPSRYGKQYEQGLYQVKNTRLYVSRGIGMEGSFTPRVRLLAPPEVEVIDLIPEVAP